MNNLGHWCVSYRSPKNPKEEKILQRINSNGVLVSASKFSQVLRFGTFKEAYEYSKFLTSPEYNYKINIRKFFLANNDNFYLN